MNNFLLKFSNIINNNDCCFTVDFYDYICQNLLMHQKSDFYDLKNVKTLFEKYILLVLLLL